MIQAREKPVLLGPPRSLKNPREPALTECHSCLAFFSAAEDDGAGVFGGAGAVGLVRGADVHLHTGASASGLLDEIFLEVGGEIPGVGVDVDDHGKSAVDGRSPSWGVCTHQQRRIAQRLLIQRRISDAEVTKIHIQDTW
jgi:hypothetical protein